MTFNEVLDSVRTLTVEEQQQLRNELDGLLANGSSNGLHQEDKLVEPTIRHPDAPPPATEEERAKAVELNRLLLEKGVISRIPPPITDFTPYRNRKLVEIKGKPLSETIIEERR